MDDERLLDLLLMQVGKGCAWKPQKLQRKRGRVARAFLTICTALLFVWKSLARRVYRAYRWVAWKTWERRLVARGRERWRKLAGIGRPDNYVEFHRARKAGHIENPHG